MGCLFWVSRLFGRLPGCGNHRGQHRASDTVDRASDADRVYGNSDQSDGSNGSCGDREGNLIAHAGAYTHPSHWQVALVSFFFTKRAACARSACPPVRKARMEASRLNLARGTPRPHNPTAPQTRLARP